MPLGYIHMRCVACFIGVQKNTRLKRVKKVFRFKKIIINSENFFHSFYSRKYFYTDKIRIFMHTIVCPIPWHPYVFFSWYYII